MRPKINIIPLTFIKSKEEVLKLIKNTIIFDYLFEEQQETNLNYYLDSTQYGYTASAVEIGSHRLLRITDINNGNVDWSTVPFCTCENDKKYLLNENDILVARTGGTTGKSFLVNNPPDNAVFASYLIRLRLKEQTSVEFINMFLNSYYFWSQIVELKSGSAQPNVNAEKLKEIVLPKCDYELQQILVSINSGSNEFHDRGIIEEKTRLIEQKFFGYNDLILELNNQEDLLFRLRKIFLKEAVQGKLVPQDPKDEPASIFLKKIKADRETLIREGKLKKDKPLSAIKKEEIPYDIPKNWMWCRLGNLVMSMSNGIYKEEKYYDTTGIGCFRMYNIKDGKINFNNIKRMILTEKEIATYQLEEDDLLVNRVNSTELLGKSALINGLEETFVFESKNIRLRLFHKQYLAAYINYLFQTPHIKNQILASFKKVTGQASISQEKLNHILVPLPPIAEQERIVTKLKSLLNHCFELSQYNQNSKVQADLLLQEILKEALQPKVEEVTVVK